MRIGFLKLAAAFGLVIVLAISTLSMAFAAEEKSKFELQEEGIELGYFSEQIVTALLGLSQTDDKTNQYGVEFVEATDYSYVWSDGGAAKLCLDYEQVTSGKGKSKTTTIRCRQVVFFLKGEEGKFYGFTKQYPNTKGKRDETTYFMYYTNFNNYEENEQIMLPVDTFGQYVIEFTDDQTVAKFEELLAKAKQAE